MILYEMLSWVLLGLVFAGIEVLGNHERTDKWVVFAIGPLAALGGGMIGRVTAVSDGPGEYSMRAIVAAGAVSIAALLSFALSKVSPASRSS